MNQEGSTVEAVAMETDANDNLADLGVLLVHGIGQSRSGDTLVRFGEPLVKWILDWVGISGVVDVEILDAVLRVDNQNSTAPARTRLRITAPTVDGSGQSAKQWLIAESYWAQSFVPPSFRELANWGFKVVPWTVYYHFHRRFTRAAALVPAAWQEKPRRLRNVWKQTAKLAFESLLLVVALLLAPALVIALALLLVLGMIPIPRLRAFVGWLQRGLALTLGDSFSLLGPNIGAAAIYGQVTRDLEWLAKRSKKVAVVGHSQGAAVAYRVVSRDHSDKCGLLVTFGSGIRKLAQIRLLESMPGGWVWVAALALVSFTVSALLSRYTLGVWQGLLLTMLVPAICIFGVFILDILIRVISSLERLKPMRTKNRSTIRRAPSLTNLIVLSSITLSFIVLAFSMQLVPHTTLWVVLLGILSWVGLVWALEAVGVNVKQIAVMNLPPDGRASPATEEPLPESIRWIDLYATSDPVPNGPVFDDQPLDPLELRSELKGLETLEVVNRSSFISDHTTYWHNYEEFISEIVGALGLLCGLNLTEILPLDRERLVVARHRRHWRVRWLHRAQWIIIASVFAVWFWGNSEVYATRLFDSFFNIVRDTPWLGSLLGPLLPEAIRATPVTEVLAVSIGGIAAFGLVTLGWSIWDLKDRHTLIARVPYASLHELPHPAHLFHFTWLLTIAVAVVLIFQWTTKPWWIYALGIYALLTLASFFAFGDKFGGGVLKNWPRLLSRLNRWTPQAKKLWARKVQSAQIALINPVTSPDSDSAWKARIVFEFAGDTDTTSKWSIKKELLNVIPRNLSRMGLWTLSADKAWAVMVGPSQIALEDSVFSPDSESVMQAPSPAPTTWHKTSSAPSLRAAAEWSRAQVELVFASTGDQEYLAVEKLLDGTLDPGRAIQFWNRIIDNPGMSAAQRAEAYTGRGWVEYRAGNLESFFISIQEASLHGSDDITIGLNLGFAALLTGRHEQAIEQYRLWAEARTSAEPIQSAIQHLELTLEQRGNIDGGQEILGELRSWLAKHKPPKKSDCELN